LKKKKKLAKKKHNNSGSSSQDEDNNINIAQSESYDSETLSDYENSSSGESNIIDLENNTTGIKSSTIPLIINGKNLYSLLDTGASHEFITIL
jgi:hypothetical protein